MAITDGVLILFVTIASSASTRFARTRDVGHIHRVWDRIGPGHSDQRSRRARHPRMHGDRAFGISRFSARKSPEIVPGRASVTIAKWALAIAIAAAIVAPWLIAIERRLPGYTIRTLTSEVFERIRTPQEGHKGPPGYYLLTIWITYFPWSLLLPATMFHAWRNRTHSRDSVRFGSRDRAVDCV